ncbi:hypothetical protein [Aestuariispira insulae]|uniref:Uncharacterized protein n=1 Tax=Aestuariispira insulae TaxID=1461337 RepID=A0A3D9HG79_9PROT|nr:hypothetical protein [Aestuariispira insulae]RED47996.1 hypothetical protein DFP90_10813 [Aestuariispira insulae]
MTISRILNRLFGFRFRRTTEQVQRHLLDSLHSRGEITPHWFIDTLYPDEAPEIILSEVLQAAQILVNRGEIEARKNGIAVDPIRTDGAIFLRIKPR